MNWYPQIGRGAIAQFPIQKGRAWRAIANLLPNGERVALPDARGGQIEWRLAYHDLSDDEAARISVLFADSGGDAGFFGFVDPWANLLGWSEDLSKPDWQKGLLQATAGVADPLGGARAWNISNPGAGEQTLSQTVDIPGDYVACFSGYVRSNATAAVGLLRDNARIDTPMGNTWTRLTISGIGNGGADTSTFGVAIGAGMSIDVFGMQVEAQPSPSLYRPTDEASGIFEETRFADSELAVIRTAPDLSDCHVRLISRV